MKRVSFIIPCYKSENTISIVVKEIEQAMHGKSGFDYEIILVNDGSPDNVWRVIQKLSKENNRILGICMSKNFGQHSALMAGYRASTGDYVVSLDDDGQTPACEVFCLIDELEKGYDVVYAYYDEIKQNFFRRAGSLLAKRMTDYVFGIKKNNDRGSSFFVMRRYIVDEICRYVNPYPYIVGLVLRSTRSISFVKVSHRQRIQGKSGYTLKSLISLWMNGFTAFSIKPIEIGTFLGMVISIIGFVFSAVIVIRKIINPGILIGWSSLMGGMLILGGIILMMLGIIGEYIGRIYICLNNSPQYVIKGTTNEENSR